ncbi:vomeronasal type-1 receptor 1-like [Erinaceus europaeus]|uniref:Vomeronasal type-1 receptor n=1 Tax=Erinaceus europaeus TaxID=9365 RepID=A0ABM3XVR0_ERIEU|nr:vomeronasal type-1 receptor 1-like [Erinaceus europaeus]
MYQVFFFFLSLFVIGFIGNIVLLVLLFNTFFFQPHGKKPIYLIVIHLTLANILTITLTGIPEIIYFFGIRNIMGDISCKIVIYFHRVCRGLSLCCTSFMSLFQAVKIAPSNSRWAWLKPRISSFIFPAFTLFWIANLLIYFRVILSVGAPYNTTNLEQVYNLKYCMGADPDKLQRMGIQLGMAIRDFLCMFLMIWTSMYMVKLLFMHQKTVQHVHSASLSPRPSHETKATHTIVALVSCFVFLNCTSCCLNIYLSQVHHIQGLENITSYVSSFYPAMYACLMIRNKVRGARW